MAAASPTLEPNALADRAGPGPHLVVLARGVGLADLATPAFAGLLPARPCVRPLDLPADPAAELLAALPADELRALGVAVDRRSLALQPPWRSDEQAVALIGSRPTGPADVTVLDLRGALAAAAAHGCGTPAAAAAVTGLLLSVVEARSLLRRSDPVHLWLVCLGPAIPVAHMIDVAAVARAAVDWPWASSLRVHGDGAAARIGSDSHRALALLQERLPDTALAGAPCHRLGSELWVLAPPRTAFGRRRVFARRSHAHDGDAAVSLPWPAAEERLDVAGIAARVAMAAAAYARGPEPTPEPEPAAPAVRATQALLPIADGSLTEGSLTQSSPADRPLSADR